MNSYKKIVFLIALLLTVPPGVGRSETKDGFGLVCVQVIVCGTDGITYGTPCAAREAGVKVAHYGECKVGVALPPPVKTIPVPIPTPDSAIIIPGPVLKEPAKTIPVPEPSVFATPIVSSSYILPIKFTPVPAIPMAFVTSTKTDIFFPGIKNFSKAIEILIPAKPVKAQPSETPSQPKEENVPVFAKPIASVSPEAVLEVLNIAVPTSIELASGTSDSLPIYKITVPETKKLFGFIPIKMEKKITASAETGVLIKESRRWYSFFLR